MMVSTTLFKSVRSSIHEQPVPTCTSNKPVSNTVQVGQLTILTIFKSVNRQKQAVRFHVCRWRENVFYKSKEGTVSIDTNIYFSLQAILKNITF